MKTPVDELAPRLQMSIFLPQEGFVGGEANIGRKQLWLVLTAWLRPLSKPRLPQAFLYQAGLL